MDNVIMTPHVGSATHVARYNLTKEAADNILNFFENKQAENKLIKGNQKSAIFVRAFYFT